MYGCNQINYKKIQATWPAVKLVDPSEWINICEIILNFVMQLIRIETKVRNASKICLTFFLMFAISRLHEEGYKRLKQAAGWAAKYFPPQTVQQLNKFEAQE